MDPFNQSTPQNQPVPNTTPPIAPIVTHTIINTSGSGQKKVGPIIAALVIVLVLVIVALYVFSSRINDQALPVNGTAKTNAPISTVSTIPGNENQAAAITTIEVKSVTNTADDLNSLQNDLNAATQGVDTQNF